MPDTVYSAFVEDESSRPLNRRERAAVVARIDALMEFWGITVEELNSAPEFRPPPLAERPIKYRHPVTGETWDGEGAHPDWLRHALLKEGLRVDELRPAYQTAQAIAAGAGQHLS